MGSPSRFLAGAGLLCTLALALAPTADAAGGSRACRATGYFDFTFQELQDGHMTRQQTYKVNILESDMHVVASCSFSGTGWKKRAKECACRAAARRFLSEAGFPTGGTIAARYETIHKPKNIDRWRHKVACGWAESGEVPGIRRKPAQVVRLVETKVVATGHRDDVTDIEDGTIRENHDCWQDSRAKRTGGGADGPRRDPE